MASNKDMRRADLGELIEAGRKFVLIAHESVELISSHAAAIPYVDPPKSANDADMSSEQPRVRQPRKKIPSVMGL